MTERPDDKAGVMASPGSAPWGGRFNWRDVRILYLREMRAALREKSIVINTILMPILLYPLLMWAMFTGIMFVQGQTEGFLSRVVVKDWPKGHPALRRTLEHNEKLGIVEPKDVPKDAELAIREGKLDALIEFLPAAEKAEALAGNFQARITFNQSKERSERARTRLVTALESYREDWLKREATARGVSAPDWQGFTVAARNVASGKQMGAFLMGLMLPLFFVIMVAVGCFYPAVDSTAGERERNTWETLMSTAASRVSIVTAKYLSVASFGCAAGALNLIAMTATMRPIMAPLLAQAGETMEFSVPLLAIPVMALAAALLAGFVAAGMMIFASFARTFKEGQAMITPFYMLVLLPVMFLQVPGLTFKLPLAFIPIVNITMMVREAITGTFQWLQIAVTLGLSVVLIVAAVRLATFILQFEDVMMGSFGGSFNKFLKERILGRSKPAPQAPEVAR
jgi:sodium transport system permease protein